MQLVNSQFSCLLMSPHVALCMWCFIYLSFFLIDCQLLNFQNAILHVYELFSFLILSCDMCASWWYQISKLENVLDADVNCIQGLHLWRNSSSEINNDLYKGYRKGNSEGKINEIVAGLPIRLYKCLKCNIHCI